MIPWKQRLLASLSNTSSPRKDQMPQARVLQFRGFIGDRDQQGRRLPPDQVPSSHQGGECLFRFATDLRSGKIPGLLRDPRVELCWWFPETKEQYRFRGLAHLLLPPLDPSSLLSPGDISRPPWPLPATSPDTERLITWEHCVSPTSKLLWVWPDPARAPRAPASSFPQTWDKEGMETQALSHFVVCAIQIQAVDYIDLSVSPTGHCIWERSEDSGPWKEKEVNP
ncbi:MAG: hypothetical protein DHS80DRAFT_31839 [Piptocephalis tieghemiana]|nr:MAG: hypothetical protein DHS80DRAFT_31839 [Piptocephalis tieghemiana]